MSYYLMLLGLCFFCIATHVKLFTDHTHLLLYQNVCNQREVDLSMSYLLFRSFRGHIFRLESDRTATDFPGHVYRQRMRAL